MSDSSSRDPGPSPTLARVATWSVIGLFLFAAVAVLSLAKEFLVPVLMAFLLSMVFAPIRRVFDRRGVPSALSAVVIVTLLIMLVVGLMSALIVPASEWVDAAPKIERQIQQKVTRVSQSFNGLIEIDRHISRMTGQSDETPPAAPTGEGNGRSMAASAMMLAPSIVAQLVFTFVLLLFLLASGDMFYEKLVHVFSRFSDKRRAIRIAFAIERKLSRYLMTITLINAGVGVAVGLAMSLLGLPDPALIGLVTFILNFVPYLGPFAGIVLVAAIAAVDFDWLGWAGIAAAVYLVITVIEGQFATPYFVGRNLRLNTVVVFVAVSFWAWLWSVIGMIVAVPVLVAVRTFCEHIDGLNPLGDFLSERHAESPQAEAEIEAEAESQARADNQS
ncbi:AI-2E family transporter [Salinisphaera sp. Q1T1-3]|uniref:AI-2E family transporter n=1 Tax=Salinisphaera sp. Q1T1-3 TaxID=2321229 RepID=UPI001314B039|nr:AI-2E family transporter [Salinisphaera sp. Q1T1-3]